MSLNRFEETIRSFADNTKIPQNNKLCKIRPIFDHFNNKFKELALSLPSIWAVDEAMEPYWHHGMKQFMRGKTVRIEYKFWFLCSSEGFYISFLVYEGRDSCHIKGLTVGESVVHMLAKRTVPTLFESF